MGLSNFKIILLSNLFSNNFLKNKMKEDKKKEEVEKEKEDENNNEEWEVTLLPNYGKPTEETEKN